MTGRRPDPLLLTPGPLTTSATVKAAMQHDWGSRDAAFIAMNRRVLERLAAIANAGDSHAAIPMQGSGTFAVEAMLGTFVAPGGLVLLLVNGAYGRRMAEICRIIGRDFVTYETEEDTPPDPAEVARRLAVDPAISEVAIVHCETTSGILNPLPEIASVTRAAGRRLLIDAMSGFGAIAVDAARVPFTALAASANKCLQGVPGLAFVLAEKERLGQCAGHAHSLSLDLAGQWRAMEKDGQWRFTPPTHVVAALDQALAEHAAEGGVAGRHARYARNCRVLVDGMRALGFRTLLGDNLQAPIIVTFHMPADPNWSFTRFYDALKDAGFVIYPGKLAKAPSFRIGCIGDLDEADMGAAVAAAGHALGDMGVDLQNR
jgi:2-aminoethylphosphonate-pyruvate transaminase